MEQIESMDRIPVYDVKGNKLDEIRLPERIMPIPARRGREGACGETEEKDGGGRGG